MAETKDEVPYFDVSGPTLSEIVLSVQEVRKMARSIENTALSFAPLTDNPEVKKHLADIQAWSEGISSVAGKLYNLTARKALRG